MIIKSYKIFERGDGVEEENDNIPTYLDMEQGPDGVYRAKQPPAIPKDYILGVPSGEVVVIDDINDFKSVIDRKMADYTYSFRGVVLNCYVAPDKNLDDIKKFVKELKIKRGGDDKYTTICKEFRDEMSKVTKKKQVVGYIPNLNGIDHYYLIIPDLEFNRPYYKTILNRMIDVTRLMKSRHVDSVFTFTSKVVHGGVKYYGLPKGA